MDANLTAPPKLEISNLFETIAGLETFEFVMFAALVATAVYFALEDLVGDHDSDEMTGTTGTVVAETSRFGDDWKQYTVEFRDHTGSMQVVRKVSNPLRDLRMGETVAVRYPLSAPHKGKVQHSLVSGLMVKVMQVGAPLFLCYILLSKAAGAGS